MSFVRIAYALKVWKFGFDAELKLSERIITRLEKMPNFNIEKKYNLLQIGSIPMRSRYYVNKNNDQNNELLNYPYYEPKNSYSAFNFFYQTDFLKKNSSLLVAAKSEEITDYILNIAKPWPNKDSIFISGDYIIIVLNDYDLYLAQKKLLAKNTK